MLLSRWAVEGGTETAQTQVMLHPTTKNGIDIVMTLLNCPEIVEERVFEQFYCTCKS